MGEIRTENWCGHAIRFVEIDGEWYAILKDICEALKLKTFDVSKRLDPDLMVKVRVNACDMGSKRITSKARKTQDMLAVNEIGIYEALFASRRLEARKFRRWSGTVMQKLRKGVGLEQYEVMRMTEPEIQDEIDRILDDIFYDEENDRMMISVTVQGGDVDQIPLDEYLEGGN